MPIIKADAISPRNIRAVIPDVFKAMPYHELKKGDKITINKIVFSVYQAKKDGTPLTTTDGRVITNITMYCGLKDGSYTSLKGDIALGQLSALTGFDESAPIGHYDYDVNETVTVITVSEKMGNKEYERFAFDQ